MRRFQHGLDEITTAIADRGLLAELYIREIVELRKGRQDVEEVRANEAKKAN